MLVRFVAATLIGWTVIDLALYIAVCKHKSLPVAVLPCVVKSIPLVLGLVVLIKATSIAEWVSEKLDL